MRTKKPLLIALFLCTWSFVSYFLLLRQATTPSSPSSSSSRAASLSNEFDGSRNQHHDLLIKLNQLEENIRDESRLHDQLVHKLLQIVRLKEKEQAPDVPHIVEIVHDEAQNVIDMNNVEASPPKIGRAHVTRLGQKNVEENVIFAGETIKNAIDKTVHSAADDPAQVDAQLKQLTREMLPKIDFKGPVIPILVFACNRISVRNCLDNLIEYRPNANQFPIIVSQVSYRHVMNIRVPCYYCVSTRIMPMAS